MTFRSQRQGSILLEFALAAPILLALIFFCLQIAHIWLARIVVQYAAYSAVRSMLTAHPGEYVAASQQAGEQICAWVIMGQAAGERQRDIPGWGEIPGSGAVARKTRVRVETLDEWNLKATVELDFGLVYPIAGPMLAWGMNPWGQGSEWVEQRADATGNRHRYRDSVPYPHVVLRESAIMSKPFKTLYPTGVPAGGW